MKIIAEIGLNHLGSISYAKNYLEKLVKTGVDGITFQIRDSNFYDKYKNLELKKDFYKEACEFTHDNKKEFGIAIKNPDLINYFNSINIDFYKIIENDLENDNLVSSLLKSDTRNIIISTGMTDEQGIENFYKKFNINNYEKNITLLHTTLSKSIEKVNLNSIKFLKEKFSTSVGFGNHCYDFRCIFLSLVYDPDIIMFYVKGNKYQEHIDEDYAIKLDDIEKIVSDIKKLKLSIGKYEKKKLFDIIPEENVKKIC